MRKIFKTLISFSMNLALSKTARNTYMVFLGNGLSAFFAFLFTVTLVRQLSYADFGYFSALLSLLLLASDLSDIGIGSSLSAFLPPLEHKKESLLSFLKSAFFLQTAIALFTFLLIYILSDQISGILFHTAIYSTLVRITAFGILATIMANFFSYALSARQKFLQVSFLSSFGGLLRLGFLLVLILISQVFLYPVVWVQTISMVFLAIIAFFLIDDEFLKRKRTGGDLRKLISFTYLLGIARGLTALASRLDVLMLIALTNATEAGIYSYASRVISIYPLLSGSFSTVIAPKLSSSQNTELPKEFMYKVILGTLGIILSIIFLIMIANPFMTILFGEKGSRAIFVFQLLLVSMIFFVASVPSVSLAIYYLRKPHILSYNSIIQLLIVIAGNFVLIPRFGRIGPAISLIVAYGITLLTTSFISLYYLRKKNG